MQILRISPWKSSFMTTVLSLKIAFSQVDTSRALKLSYSMQNRPQALSRPLSLWLLQTLAVGLADQLLCKERG